MHKYLLKLSRAEIHPLYFFITVFIFSRLFNLILETCFAIDRALWRPLPASSPVETTSRTRLLDIGETVLHLAEKQLVFNWQGEASQSYCLDASKLQISKVYEPCSHERQNSICLKVQLCCNSSAEIRLIPVIQGVQDHFVHFVTVAVQVVLGSNIGFPCARSGGSRR